jgi:hypothetical protein
MQEIKYINQWKMNFKDCNVFKLDYLPFWFYSSKHEAILINLKYINLQ